MNVFKLVEAAERLRVALHAGPDVLAFNYKSHHADRYFNEIFREEIPCPGFSQKSGVYLFSDDDDAVIYIGKAGADNFGKEIYQKFKASTTKEGYFENSPMAKYASPDDAKMLIQGRVKIHAIAIEPKEMVSIVEAYLQTYCLLNYGGLPSCNKRIG